MKYLPVKINGIYHPLINEMYLKQERHGKSIEDVLIIDTAISNQNNANYEQGYQTDLEDFLTDLQDIQTQAEERVGHIDRVDIKTH